MLRRSDIGLPPRPRQLRWWAMAVSAALHALLLTYRIMPWLPPRPPRPPGLIELVALGEEGPRAVDMPFSTRLDGQGRGHAKGVALDPAPVTGPKPELAPPAPDVPEAVPTDTGTSSAAPAPAPEPAGRPGIPRIGPGLGAGKLWVRPLPMAPRELAQRLVRTHEELVDSAVTAIVQSYIDSVVNAPVAPGSGPPSWTTTLFGRKFGVDSKYIYIGGLKIPSMVLALLPLPGGREMDLTKSYQASLMREDLQMAARRAETMEDFKRAIRELRKQREREHDFAKNQKKKPGEALPADSGAAIP